MKKLEIIVENTRTGYSAYVRKYPVFTTGNNLEEIRVNVLEALNLYFEEQHIKITEEDVILSVAAY